MTEESKKRDKEKDLKNDVFEYKFYFIAIMNVTVNAIICILLIETSGIFLSWPTDLLYEISTWIPLGFNKREC